MNKINKNAIIEIILVSILVMCVTISISLPFLMSIALLKFIFK